MRLSLSMIHPFLALGEINPRGLGPRNSKASGSIGVLVFTYLKDGIHGPNREHGGSWVGYHQESLPWN